MNVLEKILEEIKQPTNYTVMCGKHFTTIDRVEKIIHSHMDEVPVDWIPADEPPKDDNYVLLSFENFSLPMVGRYESDGNGAGSYYIGDCDEEDTCIANDLYVNAWKPLPLRYQPKGE